MIEMLIAGLAVSAAGALMQSSAADKAAEAQKQIYGEQQKQETVREQSAELDARRRRREIIRQGIIARSQALATGTSQGAQFGSAMPGAMGQITGQQNWSLQGVDQSLAFGKEIFASNRNILAHRKTEAAAGANMALGQGISSFGGKMSSSAVSFGNVFGGGPSSSYGYGASNSGSAWE